MKLLKILNNNPYFNALRNIKTLLDKDQQKRGILMFLLLLLNAAFDVLGLAIIFPLINAALQPELIQEKWYLAYLYELIGVDDTLTFLLLLSIITFIVFVIKNIISLVILYIQARYSFNVSKRLSKKFYQHYYQQGFLYIKDQESGKKAYNIINIPYIFASNYLMQTFILSTELVVLGIIFTSILFYQPTAIAVLLAVIIPTFILVYQHTKNKTKAIGEKRNLLYPQTYSLVLESMEAYPDITLGNKERFFFNQYSQLLHDINSLDAIQTGVYRKIPQRMNDIVLGLGIMVIFAFAYFFQEKSESILSILSVFGLAAYRFLPSVNRIMNATLTIKNASYVIEQMKVIKDTLVQQPPVVSPLKIKNTITFDNVVYSYPNSEIAILNNLNFTIHKGETIGFVGSSGSGKTTLLNLLLRFIIETKGTILVDNTPLKIEDSASFQKSIGYVQQAVFIKKGTLIENIAFGETQEEVDIKKVSKAIDDAMLSSFVNHHPDGLNMEVGENGVKLSGGQKQRIGIARALYKDAELFIFDEATSALDMETENMIVETINNLTKLNKTIILVAHRITTLEKCDKIYELEKGQIKNIYSYDQLYKNKILRV